MHFSKPSRRFVFFASAIFFAYSFLENAETVRRVQQQRQLATYETTVDLGTAGDYTILTKSGISTVPPSAITGDIAVSPIAATGMTGFGLSLPAGGTASTSSQVTGMAYAPDYAVPTPGLLTTAVLDMTTAYTNAANRVNTDPSRKEVGGGEIGGLTLTPGVYTFTTGVNISTDVTFQGGADDIFIIQTTGVLMLAANMNVILDGAQAKNIFWQVAGNVVVHADAYMKGIILCWTDVAFQAGSTLNGRVFAHTACNLDQATITSEEPAIVLVGGGGDPHFKTYSGQFFDYHGACDLVLINSNDFASGLGITVHVRTTRVDNPNSAYSYISSVAVKIGNDILEVSGDEDAGELFANKVSAVEVNSLAGYPLTKSLRTFKYPKKDVVIYSLNLRDGNSIEIRANTNTGMLYVDINGHFGHSEGLVGSRQHEGLFSRDGTMDLSGHWNTYGEEWQVKNIEPKLFRVNRAPQHPEGCVYESEEITIRLLRGLTVEAISIEDATEACAKSHGQLKEFCVNDVMASGDLDLAEDCFYN